MKRIDINAIKANIVFPEGKLPALEPNDPEFTLVLGGLEIHGKVNAKAARRLAQHQGGAVLQGRIVAEGDKLVLLDGGFTWIEPRPATPAPPASQDQPQPAPAAPREGGQP
jgi:hypothetical protein